MKHKFWIILTTTLLFFACLILFLVFSSKSSKITKNSTISNTTPVKPVQYGPNNGIKNYITNGKKIYEITGWVHENDTVNRKIILTNSDLSWKREIIVSPNAKIHIVDPVQRRLKSNQATIEELIPHTIKIQGLCTDSKCTTVNMISVIGQRKL